MLIRTTSPELTTDGDIEDVLADLLAAGGEPSGIEETAVHGGVRYRLVDVGPGMTLAEVTESDGHTLVAEPTPHAPAADEVPTPPPSVTALPAVPGLAGFEPGCDLELTEYATGIPNSRPLSITPGPDGALWFTDRGVIGRITTAGDVETFPLPDRVEPWVITRGPDEALWFTDGGTTAIGRITTGGSVEMFPTPTRRANPMGAGGPAEPGGIAAGPDGALWFTLSGADKIGRITTGGDITEIDLPDRDIMHSRPGNIVAGPDGRMWFGLSLRGFRGSIGTIDPATLEIRELPLPEHQDALIGAHILTAAQGAIWFNSPSSATDAIGHMTTTGESTAFALPDPETTLQSVGRGPGPDVWFAATDRIGTITASGEIAEIPLAEGSIEGVGPSAIAEGPDGATWFVQPTLGTIGRVGCADN